MNRRSFIKLGLATAAIAALPAALVPVEELRRKYANTNEAYWSDPAFKREVDNRVVMIMHPAQLANYRALGYHYDGNQVVQTWK